MRVVEAGGVRFADLPVLQGHPSMTIRRLSMPAKISVGIGGFCCIDGSRLESAPSPGAADRTCTAVSEFRSRLRDSRTAQ
jgi:hypothetical protein